MVVKALVQYRGGIAHYFITQEHEGIFNASLVRYDGRIDHYPPYVLTLIRSVSQWSGNDEETELINGLGKVIDAKLAKMNNIPPAQNTGSQLSNRH